MILKETNRSGRGYRGILVLAVLVFITALVWAKSRDPFARINFVLKTSNGKTRGMVVMPKDHKPRPVVIYLHGSGASLAESGNVLRLFAEQNLAAVGLEFCQSNQAVFNEEFAALQNYLSVQDWKQSNSVAWVGLSLGAQYSLSFALQHPELRPPLLVRFSGGWVNEAGARAFGDEPLPGDDIRAAMMGTTYRSPDSKTATTRVLIVHGSEDKTLPVADNYQLVKALEKMGMSVDLRIFPGQPHGFGADRMVLFRGLAEYCAGFFGSLPPLPVNHPSVHGLVWLPVAVLLAIFFVNQCRHWAPRLKIAMSQNKALWSVAAILAFLAVANTLFHTGLPLLPKSETQLDLTRNWLIRPESKADFDWLRSAVPDQSLKVLRANMELAELQRKFFYQETDEATHQHFILSPVIEGGGPADVDWRRALWENCYPRIRRENDPLNAAQIIVRFLRERMTIRGEHISGSTIMADWRRGMTDASGFERIYVAALRSVGIAARLNRDRQAELLEGKQWQAAPRPLFASFQ